MNVFVKKKINLSQDILWASAYALPAAVTSGEINGYILGSTITHKKASLY